MQNLVLPMILLLALASYDIFDFEKDSEIRNWRIVDDTVMGGRSSGSFGIDDLGHGVFAGEVSLENNGGFSSVRYRCGKTPVGNYSKIVLKVKGDGKSYQVRVKHQSQDYQSYLAPFRTTGDWQTIEISLADMYPSFRGRKLSIPNFSEKHIEELSLFIGNKKRERFQLTIDKITLER